MSISIKFNQALICIDALLRYKFIRKCENNKRVLIIFQQVFGDSVILQSSLDSYSRIFPKEEGYEISVLARPAVIHFMKDNFSLPQEIRYVEVDFKRFLEDYRYYKDLVNKYKSYASTLIVPGTSISAEVFSVASNARRKIGLIRSRDISKPYFYALFYKLAYNEKVRPEKGEMMLQWHRRLINHLGDKEYVAMLPSMKTQKRYIMDKQYVVLCPGASKAEKCWPIERFARISDYLFDRYDYIIHLCGGGDEKIYEEQMLNLVKYPEAICSHIGKTTFEEWSSIVEYADIVIGNDSATLHMAVAHHRKAICISGVYDKYQFFPYKVDKLNDGERLPITILKSMPCEYCRTVGYYAGYGNEECKSRIELKLCASCIDMISVDEVIEKIDILMKE